MKLKWTVLEGKYSSVATAWLDEEVITGVQGSADKWFFRALFKLVIEGKQIHGSLTSPYVELTEEEEQVFRLVVKTKMDTKIGIWRDVCEEIEEGRKKEEILEELKNKLQLHLLSQSLK